MRIYCTAHTRLALAIASVVAPGLWGRLAMGAAYITPGVPVYTAVASGMDNNTIGLGANSTSNILPLLDLDPAILAGYVTSSLDSTRELYNYNILTNTASVIYLSDASHKLSTSTPTLAIVTSSGLTVGTQSRVDPVNGSGSEGTDVFFSNNGATPVVVPVPTTVLGGGAVYTYNDSGHDNTPVQTLSVSQGTTSSTNYGSNGANANGVIAGQITRYVGPGATLVSNGQAAAPSTTLGTDGFYYDPTTQTTTAIGLSGGVYDSKNTTLSPSTFVVRGVTVTGTAGAAGATGFSSRTDPSNNAQLGRDAWYYTPNTGTKAIGLVGGNYSTAQADGQQLQVGTTLRTNSLGQVAGWNAVVPNSNIGGASGEDFWLYTPPTGPGATPGTATDYGTSAAGTYVRLGLIATPSGSTLGNIQPSNNNRFGNVSFLTNAGTAAGVSNRYDTASTYQGQAAWYFDGTTNVDISPTDSIHAAVSGGTTSSTNAVTAINSTAGLVAANVTRISGTTGGTALGQDAYVYDTVAKKDFFVDPGDEGTTGYEFSYIGVISDTGVAVGYYNTYVGTSSTVTGSVVFDWSEATGLQTLQTYTGSSAASSLSAYVDSFHFDANGNIYAPSTYGTGAPSIIEYAAVPEPTTATILAVGALGLLLRRRRLA